MATNSNSCKCPKLNEFPPFDSYNELVTIRVGPNLQEFSIHKGLLCYYSLHFKPLSNGRWPQSDKPVIDLPNDDVGAWKDFQSWLYTRRLQPAERTNPTSKVGAQPQTQALPSTQNARPNPNYEALCHMYILGDMRQIPALKNAALDRIITNWATPREDGLYTVPNNSTINITCENTLPGSRLRGFLVNLFTRTWDMNRVSWVQRFLLKDGELCAEYMKDIIIALATLRGGVEMGAPVVYNWPEWLKADVCDYHDHTDIHEDKIRTAPGASSVDLTD